MLTPEATKLGYNPPSSSALTPYISNSGNQLPSSTSLYDALTWQLQPAINFSQATPVQNTYYPVLPATKNVRLFGVYFAVATTGETLQAQIIVDGQTFTASVSATAGTSYYLWQNFNGQWLLTTSGEFAAQQAPFEGRNVAINIEKTSNNGTGTITGKVNYEAR
jgi:hypothetical protein